MRLGRILEERTHTLLGIISYDDKEIYTEVSHKKDTPVVFDIKKLGPKNKIDRAVNVYSYNLTLELISSYQNNKEELTKLIQIYDVFKKKNITTKLSSAGKRGLNIINNIRKNKHQFA